MSQKLEADWLADPATQAVFALLNGAGHRALAVGGAVRNALLGLPAEDVDMASDATPEAVMALAGAAGLKVLPSGIAHGTVTVISGGKGYEVTSFRRDAEAFGRHARVEFGASLAEDAARRDFTLNALYCEADGRLVDPLHGLPDLEARKVRFIGNPEERITEDALRILRFFRFHASYAALGSAPDPEGLAACARLKARLALVSAERIGAEMRKLLALPAPLAAIEAMDKSGVLAVILPGANTETLARLFALEAPGDWLLRLAALGGDAPEARLKLSRKEAKALALITAESDAPAAELAQRLGLEPARARLFLRAARQGEPLPPKWETALERGATARFPLSPGDLMPALSGPALGAALEAARGHWIAEGFAPGKAALLAWLAAHRQI